MRHSLLRCVLTAALPFLLTYRAGAAGDEPANLLQNPGFEQGLEGWKVACDPKMGEASPAPNAHSGKACLSIRKTVASRGDEYTGILVTQTVAVAPDTEYAFRGFARYELPENAPGHAVRVFVEDPERRNVEFNRRVGRQGAWKAFKALYRTGPKTQRLRISLGLTYASGRAWFDDVSLRPASAADRDGDIAQLKPLYPRTTIVAAGAPRAAIVVSNRAVHQALAREIVARVEAATGARLPIRLDTEIAEPEWKTTNLIALGDLNSNRFIARLYGRWYVRTDAWYPGPGGYEVRTIHDPWGTGQNVILLGGSDDAGAGQAVAAFLKLIRPGSDLVLERLMEIKLAPELQREEFARPLDERRLAQHRDRIKRLTMRGLISRAGECAFNYYAGGQEHWVSLFEQCLLEHKSRGELGYDTHMELWYALIGLDLVEESPTLTDADRKELTNYLLFLCRSEEGANKSWFLRDIEHDAIRHNHVMLAGLDAFFGGEYFQKYYHLEDAGEWLDNAARCFEGQYRHSKTQCDAHAYECFAVSIAMVYALAKPDMRFFESGAARQATQRLVRCLDNMLNGAAYGDSWDPFYFPFALLQMANFHDRDPRYEYLIRQRLARDRQSPWSKNPAFATGLPAAKPGDLDGVQVVGCDPAFYAHSIKGWKANVPLEKSFDKITFRQRLDPAAQYLLLDGLNIGSHGHMDANTIIEFSDRQRMFLVDMSYTDGVGQADHNGVTVIKDGLATELPAGSELVAAADFPSLGFSKTTLHEYSGTDWSRNILWRKGHYFLVFDQLTALESGDFGFQSLWRVLGKPRLAGNTLVAEQHAKGLQADRSDSFVLHSGGGVTQEIQDAGSGFAHYWNNYPYCEPRVTVLHQKAHARLKAAESYTLCNLFYAAGGAAADAEYRLARVAPDCVVITGQEPALAGLAGNEFQADDLRVRAAMYHLRPDGFSLVGTTRLDIGGPVLQSSRPVDVECDLAAGELHLAADAETEIRFHAGAAKITLDGTPIATKPADHGLTALTVAPGKHVITGLKMGDEWRGGYRRVLESLVAAFFGSARLPAVVQPEQPVGKPLSPFWTFTAPEGVRRIASADVDRDGKSEIVVGGADGSVHLLDDRGRERWRYATGGGVNALVICDLDGDGRAEILAGGDNSQVHALSADGRLKWTFACPPMDASVPYAHFGSKGVVRSLWAGVWQPGQSPLVVVGAENGYAWGLDARGERLWKYRTLDVLTFLEAVELTGDGRRTLIGGSAFSSGSALTAINAQGEGRAVTSLDGWGSHVTALAVGRAEGKPLLAAGTSRNNVWLLDDKGRTLWKVLLGDAADHLLFANVASGGKPAVIAGSPSCFLYAIGLDGKFLWRTSLGEEITALAAGQAADGRTAIWAGTRSGRIVCLQPDGHVVGVYDTVGSSASQGDPAVTQIIPAGASGSAPSVIFGTARGLVGSLPLPNFSN